MYTGQVTFTPISSQGMASNEIQNGHCVDEAKPPHGGGRLGSLPPSVTMVKPCSPKSIYCLANKVCPALFLGDVGADGALARSD